MSHEDIPLGFLEMEVGGTGRRHASNTTRLTLRCDAIAFGPGGEILMASVSGPERSVTAFCASLHDNATVPFYSVRLNTTDENGEPTLYSRSRLYRSAIQQGYKITKSKLTYGWWHAVAMSKRPGFMTVLTEETLWHEFMGDRYTTPLLREWTGWLMEEMRSTRRSMGQVLRDLEGFGHNAALLLATPEQLDELVSSGIQRGYLPISGHTHDPWGAPPEEEALQNLDDYMLAYGSILGRQAERSLEPLHVPGRDPLPALGLKREPFEAQAHVIEAVSKAFRRQKSILLVGQVGSGKTIMSQASIHRHANGKPYRSLVFCPGQLVNKWAREIRATIPDAEVIQIETWKNLLHLEKGTKPGAPEWYIISRDRAKLGSRWMPAFRQKRGEHYIRCPQCGRRLVNDKKEPLREGQLGKKRLACKFTLYQRGEPIYHQHEGWKRATGSELHKGCGSQLWQMIRDPNRYTPATYIKRRLKRFFDYLVVDEIHEEKGQDTAQGHAAGALISAVKKVIALTGTLIGGKAEHLRPLLFRLAPRSLIQEGLSWTAMQEFSERYGRIETTIRVTEGGRDDGEDNRMSRGSSGSRSVTKTIQPGVMPALFGRHLIEKAVFLGLGEIAAGLPDLEEEAVPVLMDEELGPAYFMVEEALKDEIRNMMRRSHGKDQRLLGAMLQTLLQYPDHPYGWDQVGYWQKGEGGGDGEFVCVVEPPNLPENVLRPKEKAIIKLVPDERRQGRKVWVYVQYTGKHDVESRVERILRTAGFRVGVLRSTVEPKKREE
jgi:tRNA A37 threonylcarbamoyladenosine biosynthesis protein TsaE